MNTIQYHCPQCGADLSFDPETDALSCKNCGFSMPLSQAEEEFGEPDVDEAPHEEGDGREYVCHNCGAVLMTDGITSASTCSFCGAPMILGDRLTGKWAPSQIIPFKITKEQAQVQFRRWCRHGILTPKGFMTADRIKSITGLYVPYWLYDVTANCSMEARCTRVSSYTRGDYLYTRTSFFDVDRKADLSYENVPADASEKLNDELMDQLEPFDYREMKPFQMPYLAGYVAEKYSYTAEALLPRVQSRIARHCESVLRDSIGAYSSVIVNKQEAKIEKADPSYVLLPIWMVCYDYRDDTHMFLMNGQTGKIVGKPPISKRKLASWFAAFTAAGFLLCKLLAFLIGGVWW